MKSGEKPLSYTPPAWVFNAPTQTPAIEPDTMSANMSLMQEFHTPMVENGSTQEHSELHAVKLVNLMLLIKLVTAMINVTAHSV